MHSHTPSDGTQRAAGVVRVDEGHAAAAKPSVRRASKEPVYCVCRQPYDALRFMIGCDSCLEWYHPECIGLTNVDTSAETVRACL